MKSSDLALAALICAGFIAYFALLLLTWPELRRLLGLF
jgi:hypothetical protein